MKKITLSTVQIKGKYYFRLPDIIVDSLKLSNEDKVELTIHNKKNQDQVDLWDVHPEDLSSIKFKISQEVHTLNMYNRIYIPERFRFFFPLHDKGFLLLTELGNIKTHLSPNGYISSGLRQWFMLNGPLMPNDTITIRLLDDVLEHYELSYEKNKDNL